tara:strand:+ start:241 stop:546 length:306 start_codon:yes stop_codon:yes gene_type:complete
MKTVRTIQFTFPKKNLIDQHTKIGLLYNKKIWFPFFNVKIEQSGDAGSLDIDLSLLPKTQDGQFSAMIVFCENDNSKSGFRPLFCSQLLNFMSPNDLDVKK